MKLSGIKSDYKSDPEHLKNCAAMIETTLEAFGYAVRVVEAKTDGAFQEYRLEVAMGVDLNKLEKHDRALALALASPTGKVHWRIPIPGTSLIGLRVPKSPREIEHEERMSLSVKGWRSTLAHAFYSIGEASFAIGRKILGYLIMVLLH